MSIDVIVPALAVILTTAVAAALIVPWVGMGILQRMRRVPSPLWAALVLAPTMIAVLIGIALLAPAPFGACHCAVHAPHHPHLCMAHPELAGPLLAPALVLLVAWAILAARGLWNVGADAFCAARWVKQRGGPGLCVDGVQVRIADCGAPLAVAAGAFTPEIIVDHELWSALSAQERRVVVQHEHAHAVRRDGLTLHVLRAAAALSLIPQPYRLIEAWRTSAELECDRYASAAVGDPLAVASALLSVERICANHSKAEVPHALLAARPGGALNRRVRALADLRGHQSAGLANDLLVVGSLISGCALIVFAWPSGGVHHTLETLLGWALG